MGTSLASAVGRSPRAKADVPLPVMAKAEVRFSDPEDRPWTDEDLRVVIGRALDYARQDCRWTLDQLARELPAPEGRDSRDPRQVKRWITGDDTAPFHVLLACRALRARFLFHLFRLVTPEVEVVQSITVRGMVS